MILRMKTNLNVESKLTELQSSLQVSSKAAVIRLAIALSLKMSGDPRVIDGVFTKYDLKKQNGADYNRFTIYGTDEIVYKVAITQHLGKYISDAEFFPELTSAHLTRGIDELYAELKLAGNKEKLIKKLL